MRPESLKGHLDLLLLAIVRDEPMHGYAISEDLRDRSKGEFDLPEGTIYPALHRLEQAGWMSSAWSTVEGRRRRVYSLTRSGRKVFAERNAEWKEFASAMKSVLGVAYVAV